MSNGSTKLVVVAGPLAGAEFPLTGQSTTLGRGGDCDIVVDDRSMSRQHARIEQVDGGFRVTDLGSQNGTAVDGRKIQETTIQSGTRVIFGKVICEIQEDSTAAPAAGATPGAQVPATSPGSGWSDVAAPARPLTADDLLSFGGPTGDSPQEAARKEEARRRRNLVLYIVSLGAVIAIGMFFYWRIEPAAPPPARGLILEVGQEKLVGISSAIRKRGGYRGEPIVRDAEVAEATIDPEVSWIIAVKGMSPGITEITLTNGMTTVCEITAVVFNSARPDRDDVILSDKERLNLAGTNISQAADARRDHPWQALQLYEKADELLRYMDPPPALRDVSRKGVLDMRRAIDKQYERLKDNYMNSAKADDWNGAIRHLQEIKALIPDRNDRRHQRAELFLPHAQRQLERSKRMYSTRD